MVFIQYWRLFEKFSKLFSCVIFDIKCMFITNLAKQRLTVWTLEQKLWKKNCIIVCFIRQVEGKRSGNEMYTNLWAYKGLFWYNFWINHWSRLFKKTIISHLFGGVLEQNRVNFQKLYKIIYFAHMLTQNTFLVQISKTKVSWFGR